jgi:hypothetical protein
MNGENPSARDPYLVKSVVHCSQLLRAFRASGEALPLREIAKRCELPKSMVFRLLYTLEKCGMVEKVARIFTNPVCGHSSRSSIASGMQARERSTDSRKK